MVRFANKQDLTQINKIREQVNRLHVNARPDIFRAGFGKEMEDLVYSMLNDTDKSIIVAEREGTICGIACVEYIIKPQSPYSFERKIYRISEFGVDEAFQRQGVGRELFAFIKQDAKEKNFSKIELDVWEFNQSAVKFYEAVGFQQYRRFLECNI